MPCCLKPCRCCERIQLCLLPLPYEPHVSKALTVLLVNTTLTYYYYFLIRSMKVSSSAIFIFISLTTLSSIRRFWYCVIIDFSILFKSLRGYLKWNHLSKLIMMEYVGLVTYLLPFNRIHFLMFVNFMYFCLSILSRKSINGKYFNRESIFSIFACSILNL